METKRGSADVNEEMGDGGDGKPKFNGSPATASQLPVIDDPSADPTGSLTDVTEDTELSPADTSVNVFPIETNVRQTPKGGVPGASTCSPVEQHQPKPLCALLPASTEEDCACAVCDLSRSFTSTSRRQGSLKATSVLTEPDGDDLCAAILVACLFCRPLDCLLASASGCTECARSLCSFLCGCEPGTLRPLLEAAGRLCDCLIPAGRPLCDGSACDVCLQASECLDLAMEISQMLHH